MKKFVKELVTNRFGIVLATLNICYLASRNFVYYAFSHGDEDTVFSIIIPYFTGLNYNLPKKFYV